MGENPAPTLDSCCECEYLFRRCTHIPSSSHSHVPIPDVQWYAFVLVGWLMLFFLLFFLNMLFVSIPKEGEPGWTLIPKFETSCHVLGECCKSAGVSDSDLSHSSSHLVHPSLLFDLYCDYMGLHVSVSFPSPLHPLFFLLSACRSGQKSLHLSWPE